MLFNSIDFLLFGILFFLIWPFVKNANNPRWVFITIMSFIFYGWWDWRFLFLLIFSGLIDYCSGLAIEKNVRNSKLYLIISIVMNIGLLSIFKYSKFFATAFDDFFNIIGFTTHFTENIPAFTFILPVGISFYSFQSLSYTIDIYRGQLKPVKNIFHFFSFLSMFPQLVAGPIIRAKDLLSQLACNKKVSYLQKWNGVKLMTYGMFQKVVIADNLSFLVDSAFDNKTPYSGSLFWWVIIVAFAFQIYCDFNGYSLIAKGLAKFMGYHFKMNFNHPYLSSSLKEFWTKWHISLSTWFRDYVYIPLGGSHKGIYYSIFFIWITMLLSGFWHGANYTFIIWGGIHAFLLSTERLTKWWKYSNSNALKPFFIVFVFFQVCVAWVFFRSESVKQASVIIHQLFSFQNTNFGFFDTYFNNLFFLGLILYLELSFYIRKNYSLQKLGIKRFQFDIIYVSISLAMIIFFRGEGKQFIYFQF